MTEKQAGKVFEKYNPASAVKRCPNGRAMMRKPLDLYARAAVNLYGIIKLDEFVEIFNAQNEEQTNADEVYTILLPNVLKNKWYGFYRDYIVHYIALHNFDWVDNLEKHQAGKPRYIPVKEKLLEFEWEEYEDAEYWGNVLEYLINHFGCTDTTFNVFDEIKISVKYERRFNKLNEILAKHDLIFESIEDSQEFLTMLVLAQNNTRIWENKGHTPEEMIKLSANASAPRLFAF